MVRLFQRCCATTIYHLNPAQQTTNRQKLNHANYLRKIKNKQREQIYNWNTFISFIFLVAVLVNVLLLLGALFFLLLIPLNALRLLRVWKWLRKRMWNLCIELPGWECQTVLQAHHKPRFQLRLNQNIASMREKKNTRKAKSFVVY